MKAYSFDGRWDARNCHGCNGMTGAMSLRTVTPLLSIRSTRRRWRFKRSPLAKRTPWKSRLLTPPPSTSTMGASSTTLSLRRQALAEVQAGQYQHAIHLFSKILSYTPDSAMDYNNRGLVYFQSGNWDAAIADYNQAITLNPRLDSAYNNRANYHAAQGDFLEAILDYDTALELNPNNVRAWINQGITFRDLQMYTQALENFDIALTFGQLEGHIYAEQGRTHHLQGDWNWAYADYQRAIAKLPPSAAPLSTPSSRLRLQIDTWLDELLSATHDCEDA